MRFALALQLPSRLPLGLPAGTRTRTGAAGQSRPGSRRVVEPAAAGHAAPLTVSTEALARTVPQADTLDALDLDQRVRLVGEW